MPLPSAGPTSGGTDGRSLTLTYDRPFVDSKLVFGVGLPAHVVAGKSLGIADARKVKDASVTAIQKDGTAKPAKIARFWETGFDLTTMPKDRSLAAVAAPRAGRVAVIAPQPSEDAAKALLAIDNATVLSGSDGPYEHLDLHCAHSRSGTFDNPIVRRAFLGTMPRQKILDELVVPLQEAARLRSSQVFLAENRATRHPCRRTARAPTPTWTSRGDGAARPGGAHRDRLLEHRLAPAARHR